MSEVRNHRLKQREGTAQNWSRSSTSWSSSRSISMPTKPFHRSSPRRWIALAFVLASSDLLASELDPVDANLRLTIVPEYYAVGSARFNDLAAVDAWLLAK